MRRHAAVVSAVCAVAFSFAVPLFAQAPAAVISAKIWTDRAPEIEAYLKAAEVVGMEDLKVGVTKPRKAKLAPGGPVDAFSWKAIKPGRYSGYWESYKSEIAAYELDKLLGLGMIPPTVEKRFEGNLGAAVMWASPTRELQRAGRCARPAGRDGPAAAAGGAVDAADRQGEDVRQSDWQYRSQPRELARRSRLEPDPDRPHAIVHVRKESVPSALAD